MKKLVTSALLAGLLIAGSQKSHALSWTIEFIRDGLGGNTVSAFGPYANVNTTPWVQPNTVTTTNVKYYNQLTEQSANTLAYDYDASAVGPPTGSNVTYGQMGTFPNASAFPLPSTGTFATPANFRFELRQAGSGQTSGDIIEARGTMTGTVGINGAGTGSSGAIWTLNELFNIDTSTSYTILAPDPSTGNTSIIAPLNIQGSNVVIWMERIRQVPIPANFNSITGFIADVPEPGSVAMLVGLGVSSGVMMLRRRRRA